MKRLPVLVLSLAILGAVFACGTNSDGEAATTTVQQGDTTGWISLFDGETLDGWRASENPESFFVEDGAIVAHGPRAHLFYVGPVEDHDFTDFEFKADVMTMPGANSGIYFHTAYQEEGWPEQGYEAQVNNTGSDERKTGSLYAVADVHEAPAADSVWFTEHIIVRDSLITILVEGDTLVSYVETPGAPHFEEMPGRRLGSGTFALQAHDPDSRVLYRNLRVRPLE